MVNVFSNESVQLINDHLPGSLITVPLFKTCTRNLDYLMATQAGYQEGQFAQFPCLLKWTMSRMRMIWGQNGDWGNLELADEVTTPCWHMARRVWVNILESPEKYGGFFAITFCSVRFLDRYTNWGRTSLSHWEQHENLSDDQLP